MPVRAEGKSRRSEILRIIKVKGRTAIQEMSRVLGITPMAVRRHVQRLKSSGLVRTERVSHGRGRPAEVCLLTDLGDSLFPRAYDRFAMDLIRSLSLRDGNSKIERLFEDRAELLLQKFTGRMAGKTRRERVRETVAVLSEEGYMAEFCQLDPATFLIQEHNCAIAQIARQYPQVCQSELCFLAKLLGAEVVRESHVLRGDPVCSYRVQFPAAKKIAVTT